MKLDHSEGFEKEQKFLMILWETVKDCPTIKSHILKRIITHVAPEFTANLFAVRPCSRKLRYVGCNSCSNTCSTIRPHSAFKIGEEYESLDFNGGTYTIKGHENGESRVGFAYFERVT